MRLSATTAGRLSADLPRPRYDRDAQKTGIVHLGIGAFHRAHQAVYTDDAMSAGDRDWGIVGVSLRSPGVRDQLQPQNGLYTVTERSSAGTASRLVGSIGAVLFAPEDPAAVIDVLSAPGTHIVSLTVTEKGYFRRPDGSLDVDAVTATGGTIYHLLAEALARRRDRGPGLTILPCDNVANNGALLASLLGEWLAVGDRALAAWFAASCNCASTMVDRIVPAVSGDDLDGVAQRLGLRDEGAVITEPFSQWVIEDRFSGPRPRWEIGGAQIVADVHVYETAKLRMLNGAHSALAYLGLAAGHAFVHQAIADPAIRAVVGQIMRVEAAGTLAAAPGQDLPGYADALIDRFENSALPHRLGQIATDGSQKIGPRWLDSLAANARIGRSCPATLSALAAWIDHVRGDRAVVDDPMANRLAALWREAGRDGIVAALFGAQGIFAARWIAGADDAAFLQERIAA